MCRPLPKTGDLPTQVNSFLFRFILLVLGIHVRVFLVLSECCIFLQKWISAIVLFMWGAKMVFVSLNWHASAQISRAWLNRHSCSQNGIIVQNAQPPTRHKCTCHILVPNWCEPLSVVESTLEHTLQTRRTCAQQSLVSFQCADRCAKLAICPPKSISFCFGSFCSF